MSRPASTYDAVIVGGGHNGLVAAAYLARAGLSCVVLERRDAVGGAAVSERVFADFDVRVSRYAYLVSLLPRRIVDELGLAVRLVRRRVSSYTPDPRAGGARGLLVDACDPAATRARFRASPATPRSSTPGSASMRWSPASHARVPDAARAAALARRAAARSSATTRHGTRSSRRRWARPCDAAFSDDLVRGVVLTDALIGTFAAADDAGAAPEPLLPLPRHRRRDGRLGRARRRDRRADGGPARRRARGRRGDPHRAPR